MDRKYNLKLDLQFRCNNSVMKFRQSDNKTSDFFIRITCGNKLINLDNAIVILAVIKPNQTAQAQFLEVREGKIYADLNSNMKDQVGTYKAQALLILEDKRVSTDVIEYEVTEDNILNQLDTTVQATQEFTMLQQMLSRLSSIELQETIRQEGENSRIEAERQREIAKQQLIADVKKLIADTNLKVETNLSEQNKKVDSSLLENSTQVTKLISDTETKMDNYKSEKDAAINLDLQQYKEATTRDIDNYKLEKDVEIDKDLTNYKTSITKEIDDYKNLKNTEINNYKVEKDLEIDTYIETKNLELDKYVAAKNDDIDNYKNSKDTLINNKLEEVDTAEQSRVEAEQKRVTDHAERETFLNSFESQLGQIDTKNVEQDNRLNSIEYVNKRQDVVMSGLLNEGKDNRLSITGEGNSVKLEHSKDGIIEVEKVFGNTMVNIAPRTNVKAICNTTSAWFAGDCGNNSDYPINTSKTYTYIINVKKCPANRIIRANTYGDVANLCMTKIPLILGLNISTFNVRSGVTVTDTSFWLTLGLDAGDTTGEFEADVIILEGDYTNKPIPSEYFEGMQSCFEDKLIDDVNNPNNGKYEVDIKVVGKNKFDGEVIGHTATDFQLSFPRSGVDKNKKIISFDTNTKYNGNSIYLKSMVPAYSRIIGTVSNTSTRAEGAFTFNDNDINIINNSMKRLRFEIYRGDGDVDLPENIQIEEGTTATTYEPYKEYKTSILLPEPLYMNNELCVYEGRLGYWKNSEKVVLDGSEDEKFSDGNNSDSMSTYMVRYVPYSSCGTNVVCDKFKLLINGIWTNDIEGIYAYKPSNCIDIRINKSKLSTYDLAGFKTWLQANPTTVIYELAEPIFVPILENTPKWILDCFNSCTVHFETNVPILSSSFTYTGNVPSVYKIEETGVTNTNDIAVTQTAVDFLLMSSMGEVMMMSFKNNTKGGNNMGAYFASRIMKKALKYEDVIRKYPEFKEDIDFILRSEGRDDLITV